MTRPNYAQREAIRLCPRRDRAAVASGVCFATPLLADAPVSLLEASSRNMGSPLSLQCLRALPALFFCRVLALDLAAERQVPDPRFTLLARPSAGFHANYISPVLAEVGATNRMNEKNVAAKRPNR